jgi:1,4-dihydroxy-2-naphthoate octaprenyltransferase
MGSRSSAQRPSIWIDLLLYPSHTLPTAAAPVVIAIGLAIHNGVFSVVPATVAFLASWLIHIGGVFTDNYRLLADHPDVREHPELTDAVRAGTLRLDGLMWAIVACFGLAALCGPYLIHVAGGAVLLFGAIGVVSSLGYSVGPFSLTKLGIADVAFFVMFGIVAVVGMYYVQARTLPLGAFVLGLPAGAIVTNVLLIDDIRDREFDALKGWHTGTVRFGLHWTRAEFAGLMAFAYALPFWFWLGLGYSRWVLLPLLTLPLAVRITRTVCTRARFEDLFPMTPRTAGLGLAYSVLLAVGIAVHAG